MQYYLTRILLLASPLLGVVTAQSCSTLTNKLPAPSMAPGFQAQLAVTGLKDPRGIQFDSSGHLLVVDHGAGIYRFSVDNCLLLQNKTLIVNNSNLNHGISLSTDEKTLFASSVDVAYSWAYDTGTGMTTNMKELVTGMNHTDHSTRTLLSPVSQPDWLIISCGSNDNLDYGTLELSSGRSQIRAFNVTEVSQKSVVYNSSGFVLGWGLRNSVGLGEDAMGQLWSVENSADQIQRNGVDVHQDNPAEELNFHGKLTDMSPRGNYGYPSCFAVWNVTDLPDNMGLATGDQFTFNPNSTLNDTTCRDDFQPPRLSFGAHQAPLDIVFDGDGQAWITFHGSWDRDNPIGYKLVTVSFKNYQPTESNSSTSAAHDVMANPDNSKCPDNCFRPVGLAFDTKGNLFMSSDATGEVYVVRKADGSGAAPPPNSTMTMAPSGSAQPTTFTVTSNGQVSTVTSTSAPSPTSSKNDGSMMKVSLMPFGAVFALQSLFFLL